MVIPCLGSNRVWLILAYKCLLSHLHNWVLLADYCLSHQVCEGGPPWAPWLPFPPPAHPCVCERYRTTALQWLCCHVSPLLPLTQVGRNKPH